MTLPADYAALISLAQAHELDAIKRQILDRNEELGSGRGFRAAEGTGEKAEGVGGGAAAGDDRSRLWIP